MERRYRLLRDLPDSKAGDVYILTNEPYHECAYYKNGKLSDSYWMPKNVEDNPDWFELIEPERIKVRILPFENYAEGKFLGYYVIEPTRAIPEEKLSLIKKAIENVLNDDKCDIPLPNDYVSMETIRVFGKDGCVKEIIK